MFKHQESIVEGTRINPLISSVLGFIGYRKNSKFTQINGFLIRQLFEVVLYQCYSYIEISHDKGMHQCSVSDETLKYYQIWYKIAIKKLSFSITFKL